MEGITSFTHPAQESTPLLALDPKKCAVSVCHSSGCQSQSQAERKQWKDDPAEVKKRETGSSGATPRAQVT